jgi:hypothetical protein
MLWRRIFMAPSLPVATMNPRKEKETIARRTAPKGRRKKTSERNCAKGSLKEIEMRCLNWRFNSIQKFKFLFFILRERSRFCHLGKRTLFSKPENCFIPLVRDAV